MRPAAHLVWSRLVVRSGLACALVLAAMGCSSSPLQRGERVRSNLFLGNFVIMQGIEFSGRVDESRTPDNPFGDAPLRLRVLEADGNGARIALHVGDDRSRTWVLTTEDDGRLRLRHDHRDPDGTPHELTDYGGVANPEGSHDRRSFPADGFTANLIPEAATNVWTLDFDRDRDVFIYDLTRHGRPRFRAVFDLSTPRLAED